jgi:hypothetical protein
MNTDTDYLPLGGHLLPDEFQAFLIEWNTAIAAYSTDVGEEAWLGQSRKEYERDHPEQWEAYKAEFKRLNALYPHEVKALKKFQKDCEKAESQLAGVAQETCSRQEKEAQELAERFEVTREKYYASLNPPVQNSVLQEDAEDAYADSVGCGCCWCAECKAEERIHCEC